MVMKRVHVQGSVVLLDGQLEIVDVNATMMNMIFMKSESQKERNVPKGVALIPPVSSLLSNRREH